MNTERLLKLADHLEGNERGHPTFDFTVFSQGERQANSCGTSGCALGEMSILWPNEWHFVRRCDYLPWALYDPVTDDGLTTAQSALLFFGITDDEYEDLFLPGDAAPWNDYSLEDDATPQQVAHGLRNFVEWKNRAGAVLSRAEEPEMVMA